MHFTEEQIRSAASTAALSDDEVTRLFAALTALPRVAGSAPRFDLVHLLWYAGALIVIGAMGLFSTLAFEEMGGRALAVTAVIYAALFVAAGHYLWHRRGLVTPGGLLVAVAVGMAPLAVFGVQDAVNAWGDAGDPGHYRGFYHWVKGGWIPMEVATIVAGLFALFFYPFPFILALVAGALWFMSMDLTPFLFGTEDYSWALRRAVSMWFGLGLIFVAWGVDLKRPRERDLAFWLHLAGLAAFWGGLTFSSSDSEIAKAIYCLINLTLIGLSIFLGRRAYALFGAIGVAIYLGHLASAVFEDSLLFPFALSLIGVAVIAAGLYFHRRQTAIALWLSERLPAAVRRLRPAHASAAA